MKNNILQYTLKVWITGVATSPILFAMTLAIRRIVTVSELIGYGWRLAGMYIFLVVLQLLFSFTTWLIFLIAGHLISFIPLPGILIKLLIFCTGILLTYSTFKALHDYMIILGDQNNWSSLLYANYIAIGWSVWFYSLDENNNIKKTVTD